MVQIAPSILSADFARLADDCRPLVTDENPMLHFDVMDGVFVPNISIGLPVLESLKKALPSAMYDVHLMIMRPAEYIEAFAKAGANSITYHVEAETDPAKTARLIHEAGCKAGISLRPGTKVEEIFPLLPLLDMVLVMSVEPGFGGQAFMPEALDRIKAIKKEINRQKLSVLIEVDGGVDEKTAPLCTAAGADILVAGSAVFKAENPPQALQALRGT